MVTYRTCGGPKVNSQARMILYERLYTQCAKGFMQNNIIDCQEPRNFTSALLTRLGPVTEDA